MGLLRPTSTGPPLVSTRYLVPLCCAAAIIFACGPHARTSAEAPAHRSTHDSLALAPSLAVNVAGDHAGEVRFAFSVTNNTNKKVEVTFPSGQTHDVVVLDSLGREVWRWSSGRMFTQTLRNTPLASRDSVSYEEHWSAAVHGKFTAVASLESENYPLEARTEFTLP